MAQGDQEGLGQRDLLAHHLGQESPILGGAYAPSQDNKFPFP